MPSQGLAVAPMGRHTFAMDSAPALTRSRAFALALALLSISFNFLQPLAHAAALRDGVPDALWSVLCKASAADPGDGNHGASKVKVAHECCLGLAHAPLVAEPALAFVPIGPLIVGMQRPAGADPAAAFAIRDGPHQPRAPPLSFA